MMDEYPKRTIREKHTENLQLSTEEKTQICLDTFLFWSNLDILLEECRSVSRRGNKGDICLTQTGELFSEKGEYIKPNTEELSLLKNELYNDS